ncbi:hypothetical protein FHU40_000636 [Nocardioides soli]|uniref:Uncharacterized protein n=1 Tax=Nocardioides soli TaxID=1036020 RepID=A0A7W4Z0V0_9ACTN|nr:hypothetical protein [Nocardioides soli]
MSTRARGRIRSSGGVCARRLRRVAVALTAPWSLAAFACVVVLGVTVAEIVGDLPNYSSWLAASMASGYAISGSV